MLADQPRLTVGQAVFTSSPVAPGRGYHLVARSPRIGDALAGHLSRWSPTHGALLAQAGAVGSLNFMPIDNQWTTISRTVFGGPEHSRRGARQVVTMILVLRHEQLAGYGNNPLTLARTAMLLGYLRLTGRMSGYRTDAELPAEAPRAICGDPVPDTGTAPDLSLLVERLEHGESIALADVERPATVLLQALFTQTPLAERLRLSFTTGLEPTADRRFRIHLLPHLNHHLRHQLASLGIHLLETPAAHTAAQDDDGT